MNTSQPRQSPMTDDRPLDRATEPAGGVGDRWCGAVVSLLRDPYTAPADPGLVDTVLASLTRHADDPAALAWAIYAVRATRELFDADDARRRTAVTVLARLIQGPGRGAVPAWQEYIVVAGPTGLTEARFALVRALHDRGLCEHALREARGALHEWTARDRGRSAISDIYLLSTVRVLDLCGRIDDARELLDDRRQLTTGSRPPVVAALATGLLGNAYAIVGHRRICTWNPDPPGRPWRHGYREVQQMFLDLLAADPGHGARLWPPTGARPARSPHAPTGVAPDQPPVRAGPGRRHRRSPPGPATSTRRPG
jgi:hypothetical protein